MEITEIKIYPVEDEKLKAFVSIILDACFVVSDIKIILGNNGLFVSMPSKKRKNGTFRDIAHPLNQETRRMFEEQIIAEYRTFSGAENGGEAPIREMGVAAAAEDEAAEGAAPFGSTGEGSGGLN